MHLALLGGFKANLNKLANFGPFPTEGVPGGSDIFWIFWTALMSYYIMPSLWMPAYYLPRGLPFYEYGRMLEMGKYGKE